jgi:hypothetical protein
MHTCTQSANIPIFNSVIFEMKKAVASILKSGRIYIFVGVSQKVHPILNV